MCHRHSWPLSHHHHKMHPARWVRRIGMREGRRRRRMGVHSIDGSYSISCPNALGMRWQWYRWAACQTDAARGAHGLLL